MVKKASSMVKFESAMDKDKQPKQIKQTSLPAVSNNVESPSIMALVATFKKEQAETTKQLMQEIANLKNTVQQFQNNMKKATSLTNRKINPKVNPKKQLPFKDYKPTYPNEIKLWNGTPYFYCEHCNRGEGCWTTSHSTNGDVSNNVKAHVFKKKRGNDDFNENSNKKQRTMSAIPATLQAALAENSESAKLLAAFIESTRADNVLLSS